MMHVRGIGPLRLGQAPPPPPPPTTTGVPQIDRLAAHPIVKVVTIGSLAATAAKVFPGQFLAPFVAMSVATVLLGIVPGSDFDVAGAPPRTASAPPTAPGMAPTPSPGAPPRVG